MKEFSKKVVVAMVIMWFLCGIYGAVIIWNENMQLDSLLSYVGAPVTGTLVLYMAKSAFENKEKIKNSANNNDNNNDIPFGGGELNE